MTTTATHTTPPPVDEDFDRGYRYMTERPEIGEELPPSHSWDGDERGEELPGTCTFETLEMCRNYARYSRGWIVAVDGLQVATGDLAGELIIADAEVVWVEEVTQ